MNRKSFDRLQDLRMINTQAGYDMDEQRDRFKTLTARHEEGTAPKAFSSFNLFQTPVKIVEKMISIAGDLTGKKVLEPSAGLGRIYQGIKKEGCQNITLVENNPELCGVLYNLIESDANTSLMQRDFLSISPAKEGNCSLIIKELPETYYDVIIMNPPFKQGADIKHIKHALNMLYTGGKLIALCYNGVKQNKYLKPICDSWEVLPEGSFKESGTMASISLITIKK